MKMKSLLLAASIAAALPVLAAEAGAFKVYKIDIEKTYIKASAGDDVVKLTMVGDSLTVSALPANGFYNLKVGDQIIKVNAADIHGTDAFIAALDNSKNKVAAFQVLRDGKILNLPIPKKGYSWFQ